MNIDDYNRRIKLIQEELEKISKITSNLAMQGKAEPTNPDFIMLMQKHVELTKLSSELTSWVMEQFKI